MVLSWQMCKEPMQAMLALLRPLSASGVLIGQHKRVIRQSSKSTADTFHWEALQSHLGKSLDIRSIRERSKDGTGHPTHRFPAGRPLSKEHRALDDGYRQCFSQE